MTTKVVAVECRGASDVAEVDEDGRLVIEPTRRARKKYSDGEPISPSERRRLDGLYRMVGPTVHLIRRGVKVSWAEVKIVGG